MISIVLVSHSQKLTEGLQDLLQQMSAGRVPVMSAGGLEDEELGTSFEKVYAALESASQADGALVFIDLGSAELTTRMVIEMLPPDQQVKILVSPAPLVEGSLAAVVAAAAGQDLESVYQAALGVLQHSKLSQDETEAPPPLPLQQTAAVHAELVEKTVTLCNPNGLHARPAAQFVQLANRFISTVTVSAPSGKTSSARSIFGLVALGTSPDDEIRIQAAGKDAEEAAAALVALVESGFGEIPAHDILEKIPAALKPQETPLVLVTNAIDKDNLIRGIGVSPGIGLGCAFVLRERNLEVETCAISDPALELIRFSKAVDRAKNQISALQKEMQKTQPASLTSILTAHLLFLEDPQLHHSVKMYIENEKINCEAAFVRSIRSTMERLQASSQAITRQRVADVKDVALRVLAQLGESKRSMGGIPQHPAILVLDDLIPSELAEMEHQNILGICVRVGGSTAHGTILARSLGIPTVIGLGYEISKIQPDSYLSMDGSQGIVELNPDMAVRLQYQQLMEGFNQARREARSQAHQPAVTLDGIKVAVEANIAGLTTALLAVENGAEAIGVLRTEFMYLDRPDFPSEEEQYLGYTAILEKTAPLPAIIRTMDLGGDKPAAYFNFGDELNPSLGLRSLRYCLRENPSVLKTQLRAILRAGVGRDVKILLPMITTLDELLEAKKFLAECIQSLDREQVPYNPGVPVGIMIETPAAALAADQFIAEADFFSIGTNDLIQYTMASDRTNPRVAHLYQPLHPAVLRLIKYTADIAHQAGKPVAVCGDMAADPQALPILLALGIRELSMAPALIPETKQLIRTLNTREINSLLDQYRLA